MEPPARRRYRPLRFGVTRGVLRDGADGVRYLRADSRCSPTPQRMTDRLVHWAETQPDRIFMARRRATPTAAPATGARSATREALQSARSIGQALLDRGLDAERPVAILARTAWSTRCWRWAASTPASLLPGVAAYSTVSQDYDKLRHVLAR
jgi:feruloyl-CoA synthase